MRQNLLFLYLFLLLCGGLLSCEEDKNSNSQLAENELETPFSTDSLADSSQNIPADSAVERVVPQDGNKRTAKPKSPAKAKRNIESYNFSKASKKYKLPSRLTEISGLTWLGPNSVASIQDEKGKIYIFDLEKEDVATENKFGKRGDYEGVELVGDRMWVVRSDGNLFEVSNYLSEEPILESTYQTPLRKANDCEGLAYDAVSHSLLIACKGNPELDKKDESLEGYRAIYAFDLNTKSLIRKPFLLIHQDSINSVIEEGALTRGAREILGTVIDVTFQPSGIAIHPKTGEIYILASVGKKILVMNREGQYLNILEIERKVFRQPEGICFAPDGTLYISNEGDQSKGNILRFDVKNR